MSVPVLTIPGIGNSGPLHWQSIWESKNAEFVRVQQADWDHPVCAEWVAAIEQTAASARRPAVLAAHSLGCLAFAHWARSTRLQIAGALLVAVPDPAGPQFPAEAKGFPVPLQGFNFPSIVVASSDDPYCSPEYVNRCAAAWGSRLVNIGPAGHINAASALGEWREGFALLDILRGGREGLAAAR
jgi:predicted alpha/beta hydrolase family esterase